MDSAASGWIERAECKSNIFLIGENAKNNPELVKREAEEGHLIGNHTYHHVEITRVRMRRHRKKY